MPIPSSTLNAIRNAGMHVTRPTYNYWELREVVAGTLTQTPLVYPIGLINVSWDSSAYTNVEIGQLYIIRSGDNIVTYGIIRKEPIVNIAFIDGKGRGDSGIAKLQHIGLESGQRITVYDYKPLWTLLSRIQDGIFYKRYDVPYTNEGSNPSPVCNIGDWRQAYADDITNLATFSFNNDNSFAWGAKTISTYLWELPAQATITSGTLSSDSITITLPQGFYLVKCTITDSGGASQTATRPVWVNGDTYLALSDKYAFEIGSDSQDTSGRNQTVTFYGDMDDETFPPAFALCMTEDSYFDGQRYDSVLVHTFVGYTQDKTQTTDLVNGEKATTFNVTNPYSWMEIIPMVSQAIVEVANPADWTDVAQGLGIPDFIIWYVLKHHTTYLDTFDFFGLPENDPPRKLNWGLNGSTIADYIKQTAIAIGGNIGCSSSGALYLRRDPSIEEAAFRDALDQRMTITIDPDNDLCDVSENIDYQTALFNQQGQIRLFTLSYNGGETDAYAAIAPSYIQMQASGKQDENSFIVKPTEIGIADPQEKTNRLAGHLLAKQNRSIKSISIPLLRNMDFFEPVQMLWVGLSIPPNWTPDGNGLDIRATVESVDRSYESVNGAAFAKNVSITVVPETFGQAGDTYTLDKGSGNSYAPIQPPDLKSEEEEDIFDTLRYIIAVNSDGNLSMQRNGTNWFSVKFNITGRVNDFAFDYYSSYIQSGFTEGGLGVWAIVADESVAGSGIYNTVKIYYAPDVLQTTIEWIEQYSATLVSSVDGSLRIVASENNDGYVVAAVHYSTGNRILRTTSAGTVWQSVNVGDQNAVNSYVGEPMDISFVGNGSAFITSGYDSTFTNYKLYYFSTIGASGTEILTSPVSDRPIPQIQSNSSTNDVYFTVVTETTSVTASTATYEVNSGDIPVLSTTGDLSSSSATITALGSDPNTPYYELETGSNVPDGCGSADPQYSGWEYGNSYTDIPPVLPDFVFSGGNGYGSEQNRDSFIGLYGQHIWNLNGEYTISQVRCNMKWIVTSDDYPSYTTCSLVPNMRNFTIRVDFYNSEGKNVGELEQVYLSPDPDGVSFVRTGLSTIASTVVFTVYHTGNTAGTAYSPFSITNTQVYTSAFTELSPTTYRGTSFSGTPTFTDISVGDGRHPLNPYSVSIDRIDNTVLKAIIRTSSGSLLSRVAESTDKGDNWTVSNIDDNYWYGLTASGERGVAWGYNRISVSENTFATQIDAYGDYASVVNNDTYIRAVKTIFL